MPAYTPAEQREAQGRYAIQETPTGTVKVRERAKKIKEEVAKASSRSAIESFATPPLPDKEGRAAKLENKLGWEAGVDGRKSRPPGSAAEATILKAQSADIIPSGVIENGYDSLGAAHKVVVRDQVEAGLRAHMPDTVDMILGPVGTPLANRDATLDAFIKDPRYKDILRSTHSAALNKDMTITDEQLGAAREALEQKTGADKRVDDELKEINKKLAEANKMLAGFDAKNVAKPGTDAYRLDELWKQDATIQGEITRIQSKIDSITGTLDQLRKLAATERMANPTGSPKLTTLTGEITAQETEQKTTVGELGAQHALIKQRTDLETKKSKAEEDKENLEGKREDAITNKETTAREKAAARADFDHKRISREDEETEYIKGMNDSLRDAGAELLKRRLQEANDVEARVIEDEAKETTDRHEKKVLDKLKTAGMKLNKKGNHEIDKVPALQFGKNLLDPAKGLDWQIENWLKAGVPAANTEELRLISERMKDKDFVDKMRAKMGPILLGRYLQAGGKLTKGDSAYFEGTDWGPNLIENAINGNKELKTKFDTMKAEGVIDQSFFDRLKKVDGATWLKILALILAGGVAAFGVAPIAGAVVGAGGVIAKEGFVGAVT